MAWKKVGTTGQKKGRWVKTGRARSPGVTPVAKTPTGRFGRLRAAVGRFGRSPAGRAIEYTLQAPEYAAAGATAYANGRLPSLRGAVRGLQERMTIPQALEKRGLSPTAALAVGLPISFAIPAIPIGKIAKGLKVAPKIVKALGAVGELPIPASRYGHKLGQLVSYRYGQPKKYARLAEEAITGIRLGGERALELGRPVSKLDPAEQKRVAQVLKGGITTRRKYAKLAEPVREEFIQLGEEAVKEGLLSDKTFKKYVGKYLPRMYRKWEEGQPALGRFLKRPTRIDIQRFMRRQNIPEDVRQAMGEIMEAGYPTTKGIAQLTQATTRAKFFRKVSENVEWASSVAKEGWQKLPKTKRLGKLSGKYVAPVIFDDIQEWTRTPSDLVKLMNKTTAWWKYGKVVVNPATVSRNLMSNAILAHTVGGLNPARVDVYLDALSDMAKQGGHYKEAKAAGLLGRTFYAAEIKEWLEATTKGRSWLKHLRKPGKFYQASEDFFKLAVFKHQRNIGKTIQEAAQIAESALFDYSKVPPSIKALRSSIIGVPFITFPYKALPALGKAFVETPTRFAQYQRVFKAVEGLSTKEEREAEAKVKPDWMTRFGRQFLKLPTQDKHGRSQYLDISYIMPWFSMQGIRPWSHPFISVFNDLAKNKDYFGREIYSAADDEVEKYWKITQYMWRQFSPSIPFLPGTYAAKKLGAAIQGKPDYLGRTRGMMPTLFDIFLGLKTYPFDVKEEKRWRMYETKKKAGEIKTQMKRLLRKPGVSPVEKQKLQIRARQKLQLLQQKRKEY